MPRIEEIGAIPRKVKPLFFLVRIEEDKEQNAIVEDFLQQIIERIYAVSGNSADFELYLCVYPYGTKCNAEPVFYRDCESVNWEMLYGEEKTELTTLLEKLNADLSAKERLKFSMGCYLPTIYLVNDYGVDTGIGETIDKLQQNRWFCFSKRWVVYRKEIREREMTYRFADDAEHVVKLSLEDNIDSFIGNLLYPTYLMRGRLTSSAMYEDISALDSCGDYSLSTEELASFQTSRYDISQDISGETNPATQMDFCTNENDGKSDSIVEVPDPDPENDLKTDF